MSDRTRSAVTLSLIVVGVSVSFAGFLSLPVYGQWGIVAWGHFGAGIGGAWLMVTGLAMAIRQAR